MRRKFLSVLALFLSISAFAQTTIRGKIYDAKTSEPLAFANVMYAPNKGVVAGFDGFFELKVPKNITSFYVTYIGYAKKHLQIKPGVKEYKIALQPSAESLGTVVISGKYVNPAIALMKRVVKAKKLNDYRKKLSKYAFTKYFKFRVAANTDAITELFDTIYYKNKLIRVDSSLYELKNTFADKDMFLIESVSEVNGINGKEKINVIATRTAGLKNPIYELLALQSSGRNVYDDNYKFLFKEYLGPLTHRSIKQYKYEIDDTIQLQKRKVIIVSYKNTVKPLISGKIYIDAKTLAIAKLSLNTFKAFELRTVHNFKYIDKYNVWMPVNAEMFIKKADDKNNLSLGGGAIFIGNSARSDSTRHTNKHRDLDYTFAKSTTRFTKILLGKNYATKALYDLEVAPKAHRQPLSFWRKYKDSLALTRDVRTYKFVDSAAQADHFERDLNLMKTLVTGYYPYKSVDINFKNLFNVNRYEGFRLQLGGKTNQNFSNKLVLDAYVAYGFKDKALKYQAKASYKLNHKHQTFVSASYYKDLQASSSFTKFGSNGLFNILNEFNQYKYYMSKGFSVGLSHLLTPNLSASFAYQQTNDDVKHNIPYHQGRIDFPEKENVSLTADFVYTPFSKYVLTPQGRKQMYNGYPKFYLHLEKNLPKLQNNYSDYYRFDLQTAFKKIYLNKNYSDIIFRLGFASEGAPLYKMYAPNSNDVYADGLFKRFSLARNNAFETIKNLSFADNFVMSLHLQHTFTGLKLSAKKTIDIRLLAKAAWGKSFDINKYQGIQSLENTYYETGIEFKRLVSTMGLGFYYRLGDYAHPNRIENMAIRLTISPFTLFK